MMKFVSFLIVSVLLASGSQAASLYKNPHTRLGETLNVKSPIDPDKKYYLGWSVDSEKQEITFEVEVETKGYVGFGLSPNGAMTGADLFIAGVSENGTNYSGDYHGTSNGPPVIDSQQDWKLIDAQENDTHTIIKFSRLLDTCDDQDFPINGDTSRVIWSYGDDDDIKYHSSRGTMSANFLIPDQPFNPEEFNNFTTIVDMVMPAEDTSYWCTLHKGPIFDKKQHVIAFEPYLPTPDAEKYTHHFILTGCRAPEGQDPDEFFGQWTFPGNEGGLCYGEEQDMLPFFPYCSAEIIFVWAKGGKRMVFPENVGYPIGEQVNVAQYYMLEIHYDNSDLDKDKKFETGLTTFYTPNEREIEASIFLVGHQVNPSLVIPPQTKDFVVTGHCASECTKEYFPEDGITIFNSLLHAHLSGRQLKLRQFRNGEELPWIDNDGLYDFNFQQNKPLTQFRKVLPGDQLTYECVYDSTWNEKKEAVTGGLTSRDEMCEGFFWYYPKMDLTGCSSSYPLEKGFSDFGITKYHEVIKNGLFTIHVDEPETLAGSYIDAISFKFNWTEDFLKEFQEKRRFSEHDLHCGSLNGTVKYPEIRQEYVPEEKCSGAGIITTSNAVNFISFLAVFKLFYN